jgi:hypothetical protein
MFVLRLWRNADIYVHYLIYISMKINCKMRLVVTIVHVKFNRQCHWPRIDGMFIETNVNNNGHFICKYMFWLIDSCDKIKNILIILTSIQNGNCMQISVNINVCQHSSALFQFYESARNLISATQAIHQNNLRLPTLI